eukprot:COSAG02_NODE_1774_length_10973_cov_18.317914_7_plen_40_part_00
MQWPAAVLRDWQRLPTTVLDRRIDFLGCTVAFGGSTVAG